MIPAPFGPMVAHLWQSTIFVAVVVLLTLALRHKQARVRCWIWSTAAVKFLVPFSSLIAVGRLLPWRSTQNVLSSILLTNVGTQDMSRHQSSATVPLILAVWACGSSTVAIKWAAQWCRIRKIARAGATISLDFPVPVFAVAGHLEPGIFGIFSPVLLLLEGIPRRLTAPQLNWVLAHELAHVRRRDNLMAALHLVVESLFWFHPLVWWIGVRLMEERERACDEEVMLKIEDPQAYAETILRVCELYLESPLSCVSGMTSSNLKRRLERIMQNHTGDPLKRWNRILLTAAAIAVLAVPILGGTGMPAAPAATGRETKEAGKDGVSYPTCAYCPNPKYPEEALRAGFEGSVPLQVTITAKGRAKDIEVLKSLGLGLDKQAVDVVKQWKFKPAQTANGKPVDVHTQIEVTFRLK